MMHGCFLVVPVFYRLMMFVTSTILDCYLCVCAHVMSIDSHIVDDNFFLVVIMTSS